MNFQAVPLLRIPEVALRVVLQKMSNKEILLLALCSENTKNKLKSVLGNSAQLCTLYLAPSHFTIKIQFCETEPVQLVIAQTSSMSEQQLEIELDRVPMRITRGNYSRIDVACDNAPEAFSALLTHTLSVFPAKLDVCIHPGVPELRRILSNPCFNHCEELTVHKGFRNSIFENEELTTIFETIGSVTKLRMKIDSEFRVDKMFDTKVVLLFDAFWMTQTDLLRLLNCSSVVLKKHKFSSGDLEELFLKWISEPKASIAERFTLGWPSDELPQFSKLPTKPWNPEERSKTCCKCSDEHLLNNFENAVDIERPDGLLASIAVIDSRIIFHVWHERFPTKS